MTADQDGGNLGGIGLADGFHDDVPGLPLVAPVDLIRPHFPGHRHRTVEVVTVGGPEAGDGHFRLGEGHGVAGMGVDDRTDSLVLVGLEDAAVGRFVGRGPQLAFHDGAVERDDDHVFRGQFVVGNAAGLDGEDPGGRVKDAGITESQVDEAGRLQGLVGGDALRSDGGIIHDDQRLLMP